MTSRSVESDGITSLGRPLTTMIALRNRLAANHESHSLASVSYTHLTLPTIYSV